MEILQYKWNFLRYKWTMKHFKWKGTQLKKCIKWKIPFIAITDTSCISATFSRTSVSYLDDVISFKEIPRNNEKIMLRFASCPVSSAALWSCKFKTKSSLVAHIPNWCFICLVILNSIDCCSRIIVSFET